jgi:hypothetical protein
MGRRHAEWEIAATAQHLLRDNKYLLFLLAPLSVLAISTFLFERSLAPTDVHIEYIKSLFVPGSNKVALSSVGEIRARYLWMASCVALLVMSLAAIAASFDAIRSCTSGRRFKFVLMLIPALVAGQLFYLASLPSTLKAINFDFTIQLLKASNMFDTDFLQTDVWYTAYVVVLASTVAAIFLLVGASVTTASPAVDKRLLPYALAAQMNHLRTVLYIGSLMLVAGVLNMGSWMRWPAAMFRDPTQGNAIMSMALGVTTFWGASFTLVTMAAYVPAALYLQSRALHLFQEKHPASSLAQQELWLKEQGLTVSGDTQLKPILAMIGPLLAGPLGAFFNTLAQQLTTR